MKINIPGLPQPIDINDISKMIPIIIAIITALGGLAGAVGGMSSVGGPGPTKPEIEIAKSDLAWPGANSTIKIGDKFYPQSLTGGMGSTTNFRADADGKYKRVTGTIGFHENSIGQHEVDIVFVEILGDGKLLSHQTVKRGSTWDFDQKIGGVKQVTIRITGDRSDKGPVYQLRDVVVGSPTLRV